MQGELRCGAQNPIVLASRKTILVSQSKFKNALGVFPLKPRPIPAERGQTLA